MILAWGHLWGSGVEEIEPLEAMARSAAERLVDCYHRALRPDWQWFESQMTYANAVLPHALFVAAERWPEADFRKVARASFEFLDRATSFNNLATPGITSSRDVLLKEVAETTTDGVFSPIGNEGWYPRGEPKCSGINSPSRPSRWPRPRWRR